MYRVYLINLLTTDEVCVLATDDKSSAVSRATSERYYVERDGKKGYLVQIRVYVCDIDDDDCECFDYDLVEF